MHVPKWMIDIRLCQMVRQSNKGTRMIDVALTIFIFGMTCWTDLYFGRLIISAVRSGTWSMNGAIFNRSARPGMYYLAIFGALLFVIIMTASSYAMAMRWLRP